MIQQATTPTRIASRILVVDDHSLLAEGLAFGISRSGANVRVVSEPTYDRVLEAAHDFRPRVVLLDLDLGDEVGRSTPLIEPLCRAGATVVVLTGMTDKVAMAECLEAGAIGVVSKRLGFIELVDVVERVLAGEVGPFERQRQELLGDLRTHRAEEDRRTAPLQSLTRREREVLAGLTAGRTAQELATEMFVSLATIRTQIRSILRKFGVNSQLAAVAEARRAGLDAA